MGRLKKSSKYLFAAWAMFLIQFAYLFKICFRPIGQEHMFRQSQTAFPVRQWLAHGFSGFNPNIPIEGIHANSWLMEFPFFQWTAFLISKYLTIKVDYSVRIVAFLCATTCALIFAKTISKNRKIYLPLLGFILMANPYFYYWGTTGLIDWMALLLGVLSGFVLVQFLPKNQWNLFLQIGLSCILIVCGALIKAPQALIGFILVVGFHFIVSEEIVTFSSIFQNRKIYRKYAFTLIIGIISGLLWTKYIGNLYAYPDMRHFWSPSAENRGWYLGTKIQYFDSPLLLLQILQRFIPTVVPIILLLIFICILIFTRKNLLFLSIMIVTTIVYILFFINLNLIHPYYQIPIYFLIVGITSLTLLSLCDYWKLTPMKILTLTFIFSILIMYSTSLDPYAKKYLNMLHSQSNDVAGCPSGKEIQSPVLYVNQGADPSMLWACDLTGFHFDESRSEQILEFNSQKILYNYAYNSDDSNLKQVIRVVTKFGGKIVSINSNWSKIIWME